MNAYNDIFGSESVSNISEQEVRSMMKDIREELGDTKKKRKKCKKSGKGGKKLKKLNKKVKKLNKKLSKLEMLAAMKRKPDINEWGKIIVPKAISTTPKLLDAWLQHLDRKNKNKKKNED